MLRNIEAQEVIASFNTWAFKREQPSDIELLRRVVGRRIASGKPVEFVLYWGKGFREHLTPPEFACLDFLAAMVARVKSIYAPGAIFRLVMTDTHARLNGHSQASMMAYFLAVGQAARERDFKWCLLDDLVKCHGGNIVSECPAERPGGTIHQLERSAARWYKGRGRAMDGAIAYFDMNMIEKKVIEAEFPDSIFVTFNSSEFRVLFPDGMPIFYMYSIRKGISVKPWFIDDARDQGAAASLALA